MNTTQLTQKLYRECRAWKNSWHTGMFLEIYYNAENDAVSFSSAMHGNSWTDDPEKIGTLRHMTPKSCMEYADELMKKIERERKAYMEIEN